MRIRKQIKLKEYRLSYLFNNETYNKLKNNLLLHNVTSNYEQQKNIQLKNDYDTDITEIKGIKKDLILPKTNINNIKTNNNSLNKIFFKSKLKINNLQINNSNNIFPINKKSYKTITNNNTSFNMKKINKSNKNLFNKKNLYNKNNYKILPRLKGSKEKKNSMNLFEREKKKQRDKYNEKLREKLLELEICEKQFDAEIYNTLSKLNEEGKKLYDF